VVRKQLYLRENQEIRLKELARELGLPEAELVRMALDRFLPTANEPLPDHMQSLAAFLQDARQIATQHRLPDTWQFVRDEAYSREEQWE
jgi:hypothetical protein